MSGLCEGSFYHSGLLFFRRVFFLVSLSFLIFFYSFTLRINFSFFQVLTCLTLAFSFSFASPIYSRYLQSFAVFLCQMCPFRFLVIDECSLVSLFFGYSGRNT